MTEPSTPPHRRYLRTHDEYRWTGPKIAAFLRALVATVSVTRAAHSVGMSRQSAYRLRARHGGELARLWDEGLAMGRERRWQRFAAAREARLSRRRGRQEGRQRAWQGDGWVQGDGTGQGDGFSPA